MPVYLFHLCNLFFPVYQFFNPPAFQQQLLPGCKSEPLPFPSRGSSRSNHPSSVSFPFPYDRFCNYSSTKGRIFYRLPPFHAPSANCTRSPLPPEVSFEEATRVFGKGPNPSLYSPILFPIVYSFHFPNLFYYTDSFLK